MAFITEDDYKGYIKPEIKRSITGTTGSTPSTEQTRAEDTAIATIREYIGGIYDCDAIFSATGTGRNLHIVKCVIALALYDLYHQTGMKDIPEHRKTDYDDTIQWLKDAGRGSIKTTLPQLSGDAFSGDFRLNSRTPNNNKW